ncbi:PqqD family protein [Nitrosococcus halophilus]|uniref:PqqD family protein n=1 Tax=Nitrosococcus halophilus TaxID=133539 RepID=UPI00059C9318
MLVYCLRSERCFLLNPTATEIWNACNGQRSIAEIIRCLGQPEEDVMQMIISLWDQGLLEVEQVF